MRDASPYPVDAPMTRTFFGADGPAGIFPRTPAIHRSTFLRQPSGCAFTQMKPRERRFTICMGIFEARYVNACELSCLPGCMCLIPPLGRRGRYVMIFPDESHLKYGRSQSPRRAD